MNEEFLAAKPRKDRIRQSVCRWCFQKISIEELARNAASIGLTGIDLVEERDWPILKQHGVACSMTPSHSIAKGLNDPANHQQCIQKIRAAIEATAAAAFENVICFSGNRQPDISDDIGLDNCQRAIKEFIGLAEKLKVTVCMELLNSKVNHPGYMCDGAEWGAALVDRVGSDRFKLIYDIYHMQVQEGNVIATIQKHKHAIGHYHTAGVPGRAEIDESQELFYPAIMHTIAQSGFTGYVAHEFIPTRDPMASLREAMKICDI